MAKGSKRKRSGSSKTAPARAPKARKTSATVSAASSQRAESSRSTPVRRSASVEEVPDEDELSSGGSVHTVSSDDKIEPESAEDELARLQKKWNSPVYAFFRPEVTVLVDGQRRAHVFTCGGFTCTKTITRYLDTGDATSTNNLRNHVKGCKCWGEEVLEKTKGMTAKEARLCIQNTPRAGSITAAFARVGKKQVTFSTRQHTKAEARAEIIRWVSENKRPFDVVTDRGFVKLMKTGRPSYVLPSPTTVSRDVKRVFTRVRQRVANMLREHEGRLSFATDTWTSPNHRAFMAITVHLIHDGKPLSFLLETVEVADSHSGILLSREFVRTLAEFMIKEKLLSITTDNASNNNTMVDDISQEIETFPGEAAHTRCLDHICHLCAKSLLRPFDISTGRGAQNARDATEASLQELASGLELEPTSG